MVQGVVVQITAKAGRSGRPAAIDSQPRMMGKRTRIDGDFFSSYSTSASASAVRQEMHQCTGLCPR